MPTITLLIYPEYQCSGVTHLHVFIIQHVGVTVRLYALPVLLSEILIDVYLSNKMCRMAYSPDPRRILILPLRSQRRKRAAVRVMTPHPNVEFVTRVEDCVENFISILSLHAKLLSSAVYTRK